MTAHVDDEGLAVLTVTASLAVVGTASGTSKASVLQNNNLMLLLMMDDDD